MACILKAIPFLFVILLVLPHQVFAQEYLTVKPAFSSDHSDACSIVLDNKVPNYQIRAFPKQYVSNHALNDLNSNYTRTTMISYNNTMLIVTLSVNSSKNNGNIYGNYSNVPYLPLIYTSDSPALAIQTLKKINLGFGEHVNFTLAFTNIGNKTVTITHPFYNILGVVTNFENGTSVQKFRIDQMEVTTMMEMPTFSTYKLEPNHSLVQYYDSSHLPVYDIFHPVSSYYMVPTSGNYAITSFARFLGDVNGTCSMIYLWSQPVNLVVTSSNQTTINTPEFPIATIPLVISLASILVFYRIKSKF